MKTLGFVGMVKLGQSRADTRVVFYPHEVIQVADTAAEEVLRAHTGVCDLTLSPVKSPYGHLVPRVTVSRYESWNEAQARRHKAARR